MRKKMDEIFDFDKELNYEPIKTFSSSVTEIMPVELPVSVNSTDKELTISKKELDIMPSYELEGFAKKKAKYILEKIQNASEKVEAAKKSAESAKNTSGLFITKKKTDINTETTIILADALKELNEIVQESIAFTCLSIEFAKCMVGQISTLMVSGFQDSSGHIVKLNSTSKEQAQIILTQAQHFSNQQIEIKQRQNLADEKLFALSNEIENSSQRLNSYDSQFADYSSQINELKRILDQQDFRISQLENEIRILKQNV